MMPGIAEVACQRANGCSDWHGLAQLQWDEGALSNLQVLPKDSPDIILSQDWAVYPAEKILQLAALELKAHVARAEKHDEIDELFAWRQALLAEARFCDFDPFLECSTHGLHLLALDRRTCRTMSLRPGTCPPPIALVRPWQGWARLQRHGAGVVFSSLLQTTKGLQKKCRLLRNAGPAQNLRLQPLLHVVALSSGVAT